MQSLLMPEIDPNTFLSGPNADFIAELYARYLEDPDAVDASWRRFFAELGDDAAGAAGRARRAGLGAAAAVIGQRRRPQRRRPRSAPMRSSRRRSIRSAR